MKTAILIGATGATGRSLLDALLADERYTQVHIFVRRGLNLSHPKLTKHLINFDTPSQWQSEVKGDVLFSCLGTTLKQADSKAQQWKIDYEYQLHFAKVARQNSVSQLVLVSSAMADASSSVHYTKMKGALEEAVTALAFPRLVLVRPPMLIRPNTSRWAEIVGVKVLQFFNRIGLFKKMRPMSVQFLAQAMLNLSHQEQRGIFVLENEALWQAGDL